MAPQPGRRPHRKSTGPAPRWLQQQRAAIAGYQKRRPNLNYNQVRQDPEYRAAFRVLRRETERPASRRDASALASARKVLGIARRPHRRHKGEVAPWLLEYRAAIASYGRKHDIKGPGAYGRIRSNVEFRTAWRDLKRETRKPVNQWDRSPDGPIAQALVTLGLREQEDFWQVGETVRVTPETRVSKVG